MTDRPNVLLAFHNHQPVGNFRSVFEQAFEDCYRPFLREAARHPRFKFAAHYSGPLLEYMREKEAECWAILRQIVGRGQVELLGGGFYEPVLSVIPERDRLGQLRMMNDFLEEHFGTRPRGIWLTERVWEPDLPRTLSDAGIEYTFLDEEHFHCAGVREIHDYYITEDEGRPLKIFPIDKKLRYLIPFHELGEVEVYLQTIASRGGLAVLGDDGEKFGLWPGTKAWVYDRGWLVRFLRFLEDRDVRMMTGTEAMQNRAPAGRVYLPPASYEEMMEWVLEPGEMDVFLKLKESTPAEARRFLHGGFFREFFLKYPESNHLHKRMVTVSGEVEAAGDDETRRELYRAQGNDPYWHGVFGGLYLPHLRESAYEHLLKAERALPGARGEWRFFDFDADGRLEAFARGEVFGLIVRPESGGEIIEIDHYPSARNLTDVLARRREAYHLRRSGEEAGTGKSIHELKKDLPPGAERLFLYDSYPRFSSLDHILPPGTDLDRFRQGGPDLSIQRTGGPYQATTDRAILRLSGELEKTVGGTSVRLAYEKTIELAGNRISVIHRLNNLNREATAFVFGTEWNLYQTPEEIAVVGTDIRLCSGRLALTAVPPAEIRAVPLQTLSQSERGYDIIHQGFCFLLSWDIKLPAGGEVFIRVELVERHESAG